VAGITDERTSTVSIQPNSLINLHEYDFKVVITSPRSGLSTTHVILLVTSSGLDLTTFNSCQNNDLCPIPAALPGNAAD